MAQADPRARRALASSAWAVLGFIVLGYVMLIPDVETAIENAPQWSLLSWAANIAVIVAGASMLALFASAIWYARGDPKNQPVRPLLLAILIFGNAVAGFFYYFCYVLWTVNPAEAKRQGAGSTAETH